MDTQSLTDFITLAELGSFSRAAKTLNVTQPAFSRRIRALEEQLGLQLIDRTTTPVRLTPAGQLFLDHARALAAQHARMTAELRAMTTHLPEALHIQMSRSLSCAFFPLWYKAIQTRLHGLSLRLTTKPSSDSADDLRSRRTDFAVQVMVHGAPRDFDDRGLLRQRISRDRLHFVKAAHLKNDTASLISYGPASYMTVCLKKLLDKAQLARLKVTFESQSAELSHKMALAGFGAALLPENLIADDLKDGYLVPALSGVKPLPAEIHLLRSTHPLPSMGEKLWTFSKANG